MVPCVQVIDLHDRQIARVLTADNGVLNEATSELILQGDTLPVDRLLARNRLVCCDKLPDLRPLEVRRRLEIKHFGDPSVHGFIEIIRSVRSEEDDALESFEFCEQLRKLL